MFPRRREILIDASAVADCFVRIQIVYPPEPAGGDARKHHGQMDGDMYCPTDCRSHGLAVCDIPEFEKIHRGGNGHMGGGWNSAPGGPKHY